MTCGIGSPGVRQNHDVARRAGAGRPGPRGRPRADGAVIPFPSPDARRSDAVVPPDPRAPRRPSGRHRAGPAGRHAAARGVRGASSASPPSLARRRDCRRRLPAGRAGLRPGSEDRRPPVGRPPHSRDRAGQCSRSAGGRMHAEEVSQYPPCEWGMSDTIWRVRETGNRSPGRTCGERVKCAACPVHNPGDPLWTIIPIIPRRASDLGRRSDMPVNSGFLPVDGAVEDRPCRAVRRGCISLWVPHYPQALHTLWPRCRVGDRAPGQPPRGGPR